jgi:hypothetical protein
MIVDKFNLGADDSLDRGIILFKLLFTIFLFKVTRKPNEYLVL